MRGGWTCKVTESGHSNGEAATDAPRIGLTNVWSATASFAGVDWPPSTSEAALRLFHEADQQFLLPLLLQSSPLPGLLSDLAVQFKARVRVHELRHKVFAEEMQHFTRILASEPFIVLKGWDYAFRIYPRPELRPMSDLDIFVPAARSADVCALLARSGFTEKNPAGMNPEQWHERVFVSNRTMIEVHRHFIQPSRNTIDYAAIWTRAIPFPPGGPSARRLSNADAIAYHALSMSNDEFSVRLIRFVDFALLLTSFPDDLEAAADIARSWCARRAFYGSLRLTTLLFPELARSCHQVMEAILPRRTRVVLDRFILPDPFHERGGHSRGRPWQLWRKHFLLDSWTRRIAFASATLRAKAALAASTRS